MMPWGHLAVGYVCYSLGVRTLTDEHPADVPSIVLAAATQVPDLVDKPLDVLVPALEGRSFLHSFVFVIPLLAALVYVSNRYDRRPFAAAVSVGFITHLVGDALPAALDWGPSAARFLLWPFLPSPYYPTSSLQGYVWLVRWKLERLLAPGHFLGTILSGQGLLLGGCFVLWALDGYPGLDLLVPDKLRSVW